MPVTAETIPQTVEEAYDVASVFGRHNVSAYIMLKRAIMQKAPCNILVIGGGRDIPLYALASQRLDREQEQNRVDVVYPASQKDTLDLVFKSPPANVAFPHIDAVANDLDTRYSVVILDTPSAEEALFKKYCAVALAKRVAGADIYIANIESRDRRAAMETVFGTLEHICKPMPGRARDSQTVWGIYLGLKSLAAGQA